MPTERAQDADEPAALAARRPRATTSPPEVAGVLRITRSLSSGKSAAVTTRRYVRAVDRAARIAIVGDYSEQKETHRATTAEFAASGADCVWVATDGIGDPARSLGRFAGLVIAPGGPYADVDGALAAIGYARERQVPLVGMCSGFQYVVLEFARSVLGLVGAVHGETDPEADQRAVTALACSLVGQRHRVRLEHGSRVAAIYGADSVIEPFYCSYGVNPVLEEELETAELHVSGRDDEASARVLELADHPFFVATLYVFTARDDRKDPHPLTTAFLDAARAARPAA
jgi:CTP synthase (UTP-ammonia lyase)